MLLWCAMNQTPHGHESYKQTNKKKVEHLISDGLTTVWHQINMNTSNNPNAHESKNKRTKLLILDSDDTAMLNELVMLCTNQLFAIEIRILCTKEN